MQKCVIRSNATQELQEIVADLTYPLSGFNEYHNYTYGDNSDSNYNDDNNNNDNDDGNTGNKHKNTNNGNIHFCNRL